MGRNVGIFREEAVAHRVSGIGPNNATLQGVPCWTQWLFWALLLLSTVAMLYAWFGRVGREITGQAVICTPDGSQPVVFVFFPGQYQDDLHPGLPLQLHVVDGVLRVTIEETGINATPDPALLPVCLLEEAESKLGSSHVLVKARLLFTDFESSYEPGQFQRVECVASARIRGQRILGRLVPSLTEMFGEDEHG